METVKNYFDSLEAIYSHFHIFRVAPCFMRRWGNREQPAGCVSTFLQVLVKLN